MEFSKFIQQKDVEYAAIKKFFEDNAIEINAGYPPMKNYRDQFMLKYPYFTGNYAKAIVDTKPYTGQKTTDKHSMANTFGPLAETGWSFGDQIKDDVLKGKMNLTKAKIFNATDENAPTICQNIYNDLKGKLPNLILTGTYLIDLTLLDADLLTKGTYESSSAACNVAITNKSTGRENLSVTSIPELDAILVNMAKVLSHMSPDFQTNFTKLHKTDTSTGVRHDHLLGGAFNSVTSAGIDGVQVKMVAHPEHVTHTNLLFEYELNTFPSGTWQFEVSKIGYHTILVTLTIGKGKTVHHDFMLVPITPPPTV